MNYEKILIGEKQLYQKLYFMKTFTSNTTNNDGKNQSRTDCRKSLHHEQTANNAHALCSTFQSQSIPADLQRSSTIINKSDQKMEFAKIFHDTLHGMSLRDQARLLTILIRSIESYYAKAS